MTDVSLPFVIGSEICHPISGQKFKLRQVLGSGTFAVVFRVAEQNSAAEFALKCLSKKLLDKHQLRLQQEESTLHRTVGCHPNIAKFIDSFETEEWLFLLVEYVCGMDLFSWLITNIDASGCLGKDAVDVGKGGYLEMAFGFFRQALDATSHIHSRGVFHRDLKPENFVIDSRTASLKLIDFGLATSEEYSRDWEYGSKPYMSYECRNGASTHYSPRKADVWSLGVLLLNLLTRRSPWDESHRDCRFFSEFLKRGATYLIEKLMCPPDVAEFLASRVFTKHDADRCSLTSLWIWADRLSENPSSLLPSRCEKIPTSFASSSSSSSCSTTGSGTVCCGPRTECDEKADISCLDFSSGTGENVACLICNKTHKEGSSPKPLIYGCNSSVTLCSPNKTRGCSFPRPPSSSDLKSGRLDIAPTLPKNVSWAEWDEGEADVDFSLPIETWLPPSFGQQDLRVGLKETLDSKDLGGEQQQDTLVSSFVSPAAVNELNANIAENALNWRLEDFNVLSG